MQIFIIARGEESLLILRIVVKVPTLASIESEAIDIWIVVRVCYDLKAKSMKVSAKRGPVSVKNYLNLKSVGVK